MRVYRQTRCLTSAVESEVLFISRLAIPSPHTPSSPSTTPSPPSPSPPLCIAPSTSDKGTTFGTYSLGSTVPTSEDPFTRVDFLARAAGERADGGTSHFLLLRLDTNLLDTNELLSKRAICTGVGGASWSCDSDTTAGSVTMRDRGR